MSKLISAKSIHSLPPGINYNSIPASSVGIESTRNSKITTKNAFLPDGPWEFSISHNSKAFINLARTRLNIKFRIVTDRGKVPPPALAYAPCQQFAASLVNSYHLKINDVAVYDSGVNHAYKSYFENTLMYSNDVKQSRMGILGYYMDNPSDFSMNPGFATRRELTRNGQVVDMSTPVSIDLFNQERLFINYSKMELVAFPNKPSFLIDILGWEPGSDEQAINMAPPRLRLDILDIHLVIQEFDLNSNLTMAIEQMIAKDRIHYPITAVRTRYYYIEPGRMDSANHVLFTSHTPKRLVVGLVNASGFNGAWGVPSFYFQPFGLKNIYLTLNNRVIPTHPYNLDWNSSFATAYVDMLEGLGLSRSGNSNGITPKMYQSGHTFFVFDISPTVHSPDLFDVIQQGNVSLKLEFDSPTPADGIYAIVYAEYDSILSIDQHRTPYLDTSL